MYNVNLARLSDNPFQGRTFYDAAGIEELANSIKGLSEQRSATKGLLQLPVGRLINALGELQDLSDFGGVEIGGSITTWLEENGLHVQLAFGHRRREAFDLIARGMNPEASDFTDPEFLTMPVIIEPLDDEQMAVSAFTENLQRDDPSALDTATAISLMMDEFGWTQKHTAMRLGLSRPRLSNIVRLLRLPLEWRTAVSEGEVSERQAQAILPVVDLPAPALERAEIMGRNTDKILKEAKDSRSSDYIRDEVERMIASGTFEFDDDGKLQVHVREEVEIDDDRIVQAVCITEKDEHCEFFLRHKAKPRCGNPACFKAKMYGRLDAQLALAAEVLGLPVVLSEDFDNERGIRNYRLHNNDSEDFVVFAESKPDCLGITATFNGWSAQQPRSFEKTQIYYICTEENAGYCHGYYDWRREQRETGVGAGGLTDQEVDWEKRRRDREELIQKVADEVITPAKEVLRKAFDDKSLGAWRILAALTLNYEQQDEFDIEEATLPELVDVVSWRLVDVRIREGMEVVVAKATVEDLFDFASLEPPWESVLDTPDPDEDVVYEEAEAAA